MDRKIIEKFVLSALIIMGCSAVGGLIWANSQNQLQQQAAVEEAEKEPGVESDAYILAKGDYSNLEELLTDVDKPVYDRYTLKQRQEKGLPTMLPPLAVYNKEKVAYLTFDDGPDNKNTLAILDILKANGIHGTFYVTGKMCEENPTVLKRIFEEGHAIGNHSYDHDYKRLYQSKDSFLAEMQQTVLPVERWECFPRTIIRRLRKQDMWNMIGMSVPRMRHRNGPMPLDRLNSWTA